MMDIVAGGPLVRLLGVAYRAGRPVLLHGRHGVGKSQVVERAAKELRLEFVVRDLSLMEPPDLVGIPQVREDGRTHYAPPAFLPSKGRGILMIEELNRAAQYMRATCLQLLTARRLNDYALPEGWLPCAAVNDAEDGYEVEELDEALRSRFVNVRVAPDVTEWVRWARSEGGVHPEVAGFVEACPGVFGNAEANPRAWKYVSDVVAAWERSPDPCHVDLATCVAGLVGDEWAVAFLQAYGQTQTPLTAPDIISGYPTRRAAVRRWVGGKRLDLLSASLVNLQRHLQRQKDYQDVVEDPQRKQNVEEFLSDLPAVLKRQASMWLAERHFTGLAVGGRAKRR